jgi:hypothetical protein
MLAGGCLSRYGIAHASGACGERWTAASASDDALRLYFLAPEQAKGKAAALFLKNVNAMASKYCENEPEDLQEYVTLLEKFAFYFFDYHISKKPGDYSFSPATASSGLGSQAVAGALAFTRSGNVDCALAARGVVVQRLYFTTVAIAPRERDVSATVASLRRFLWDQTADYRTKYLSSDIAFDMAMSRVTRQSTDRSIDQSVRANFGFGLEQAIQVQHLLTYPTICQR